MVEKTDLVFCEIALRLGLVSEAKIKQCLQLLASLPQHKPIGQIMVEQNYLTQEQFTLINSLQIEEVLRHQPTLIISCPKCRTNYNVVFFNPGARFICWKCENELTVPREGHHARGIIHNGETAS